MNIAAHAAPGMNTQTRVRPLPSRGKLLLGGLLLYLLFLILQMPLAWLIAQIPDDSPVQLRQASGSPWNGEVGQVTWKVDNDRLELGNLAWRWIPGELLHGRIGLNIALTHQGHKLTGTVLLANEGLQLKNLQGSLDAAILGFASRPLSLLQPQGSLSLDIPALSLKQKRIHGEARVDWQNARSGQIAAPLGDYRAALNANPDGRSARLNVHTLRGALAMNGEGEFSPAKGISGSLRLTPPQDESRNRYTPFLSLLGRPDASGTWVLSLNPR